MPAEKSRPRRVLLIALGALVGGLAVQGARSADARHAGGVGEEEGPAAADLSGAMSRAPKSELFSAREGATPGDEVEYGERDIPGSLSGGHVGGSSGSLGELDLPAPILESDEALERSLALLPASVVASQVVVRRVTLGKADEWLGSRTNDFSRDHPVWLIGLEADGLVWGDVLRRNGLASDDDTLVYGLFFMWDAASGLTIAEGALRDRTDLATLARLANETGPVPAPTIEAVPTLVPEVRSGSELPPLDSRSTLP